MAMGPGVAVKTARMPRRLQFEDFPAGGQQIKIPVHRGQAYMGHALAHDGVQLLRRGVAGHFPQFLQNEQTLFRRPGFHSLPHGLSR
jgi:hypothetical protein